MNYEEALNVLTKHGQEHLLQYYSILNEKDREHLLSQISNIDFDMLEESIRLKDTFKKGTISPIKAMSVDEIKKNEDEFRSNGLSLIKQGKLGAVLLAGGQGTRLGFDKPKGMLNVGINKDLYLFEILINNLKKVVNEASTKIHLFVMTSEKNNADTINFFEEKNYFGYDKSFIHFFVQEMAPATDFNGKVFMEDINLVSTSPNGNGGWFYSMSKHGITNIIKDAGIEWLNVFSVDNVLQNIADPIFLGATVISGCQSGAKGVRKATPEERVGVLCLEDGKPSIVEYYELTEAMRYEKNELGELTYSFGVTLNYLFRVSDLLDILNKKLSPHVVEKKIPYIDEEGKYIKPEEPNGYKFETLVLDMIHMLDSCLPFEILRNKEFAPIKNSTGVDSLESARKMLEDNDILL